MPKILGIGPLSPPPSGPGQKNSTIISGLKDKGLQIEWIDTYNKPLRALVKFILVASKYDTIILSVSHRGRAILAPIVFFYNKIFGSSSILLPAGGKFHEEILSYPPVIDKFYLQVFSSTNAILPESESMVSDLSQVLGSNVEIRQFPNPRKRPKVTPDFYTSESDRIKMIHLGRLCEEKGTLFMLESFNNIPDDEIELDIYGSITGNKKFRTEFYRLVEGDDRVKYLGVIPHGEVISKLNEYDIFIFPTRYPGEGFPGVLVEAMMAGLMIIASDWNYNSEIVIESQNGLLFNPYSSTEFEEIIQYVADNPSNISKFQKYSWELSNEYCAEYVIDGLIDIINSLN